MLGRDVVAVGGKPAEIGGALLHQRQPPVGQVGRDLHAHVRHQLAWPRAPARASRPATPPGPSPACAWPRRRSGSAAPRRRSAPARRRGSADGVRSSAGSPPAGGRCSACTRARASSAWTRCVGVSPMPTRIPLVNGILSSPASRIVCSRRSGCLVGEPWWAIRSGYDRLQHQALRGRDLAQAGEVVAGEHPEVGVRQHPPLQRAVARPRHVGGEVPVAVALQPPRHLGVDLRLLAGQHQQLLGVSPHRVVEQALDLVRVVEVGPVGGERAVLAVAPAGARQRQRVVPAEGDPPHARESRGAQPTGCIPPGPFLPGAM